MALIYVQRIYDTTLGQYVRYETQAPTSSPNPASTTPVSTGSYDTAKHQILQVYDDPAVGGGGGGGSDLVYDSLAVPSGNVYSTWATLYTAIGTVSGPVTIALKTNLTIPAGAWTLNHATFVTYDSQTKVTLADSAIVSFSALTFDGVNLEWVGTSAVPLQALGSPATGLITLNRCTVGSVAAATYPLTNIVASGVGLFYVRDNVTFTASHSEKLASVQATGILGVFLAGSASNIGANPYTGTGILSIMHANPSSTHGATGGFSGTLLTNYESQASLIVYSDGVAPVLGSTNVQGAIDAIKPYLGVAPSNILFQWNQTDISQFDLSSAVSSPSGNLQNSNYFLVDIYNYGRNYLRIRGGSLLAQYSYLALPILTSAFASALPNRYEIEIELEGNQTAIAAVYCGPLLSWLSPTGTGCGIGATQSATAPARRVFESGASVLSSDSDGNHSLTPFAPQSSNYRGGNYRFRVEHYLNAGQPTAIVAQAETHSWWQWSVTDRYPYRSLVTPELFRTTAAWNDYVPNTVGLYFVHATALGGNTDILIRDIIVRKHPKDM